jgi:hypothetical protein
LRRIYADHLDAKMRSQYFGKAPCAAAKIDDQRHLGSIDMNGEQVLPEPKRFRRECAGLVVRGRDLVLS